MGDLLDSFLRWMPESCTHTDNDIKSDLGCSCYILRGWREGLKAVRPAKKKRTGAVRALQLSHLGW